MADPATLVRTIPTPSDAAVATLRAAASLWLLAVVGVAAPAAALAVGPRPPTTAAGATQVLLVALAPAALLYVPYAVRREVRPAAGSDRATAAVAAGAGLLALAAAGGVVAALEADAGATTPGLPALALVLPAFGIWLHRRGRAVGDPDAWTARNLPDRGDLRRPGRLVADPRKAGNAALVAAHALVLAAAGNLAWRLAARGISPALVLAAALAYGGWYVGQAFAVRAGVWEPRQQ